MKIRLDYVSNSSSSSFMLVGTAVDANDLKLVFKNHGLFDRLADEKQSDYTEDEEEDEGLDEFEQDESEEMSEDEWLEDDFVDEEFWNNIEDWLEEFGLKFENGLEEFYEQVCVGLSYEDMENDETKEQFEKRVGEALEKLFGEPKKVECMIDGGRDS